MNWTRPNGPQWTKWIELDQTYSNESKLTEMLRIIYIYIYIFWERIPKCYAGISQQERNNKYAYAFRYYIDPCHFQNKYINGDTCT